MSRPSVIEQRRTSPPSPSSRLSLDFAMGRFRRVLRRVENFSGSYDEQREHERAGTDTATVVTSEIEGTRLHAPVLDLDIEHALIPSSTPGHAHLFLNVALSWREYRRLLKALARAGVIEPGYVKMSLRQGYSTARVPWVRK